MEANKTFKTLKLALINTISKEVASDFPEGTVCWVDNAPYVFHQIKMYKND